jgi:uncharacterized membrane protein YkoI
MKKLLLIFTVAAMSFATVQATNLIGTDNTGTAISFENKVKISPEELPAPVKTAIDNNFADWDISAAYMYTESKQYEVEFQQDGQTQTVKFDKDGNVLS